MPWILLHSQDTVEIAGDLRITPLTGDVFQVTHIFPRFGSNSLFVALPGKLGVLVDTPHESSGTRDLLDWIETRFGKLELKAINTGWHQDNLGGNEYLRSRGIDVYGPDRTAELIAKRGDELKAIMLESVKDLEDRRFYRSYESLRLVPPNKLFPIQEGLLLKTGGEIFEVYFPGESHTADNTVVYLHNRKILFGGCMILSMLHQRPGFTAHANLEEWPRSVEKVQLRFPDCIIVVPGHGQPGDASLLQHTVEVLDRYRSEN